LMLDIVINRTENDQIDINALRLNAPKFAERVTGDSDYDQLRDELKALCLVQLKGVPQARPAAPAKPSEPPKDAPTAPAEPPKDTPPPFSSTTDPNNATIIAAGEPRR